MVRPLSTGVVRRRDARSDARLSEDGKSVSRLYGVVQGQHLAVDYRHTAYLELVRKLLCVAEDQPVHSILHKLVEADVWSASVRKRTLRTYHAKSRAHTGNPQPNMSTIFIGRSSADELECSEMPTSADPTRDVEQSIRLNDTRI